MSFRQQDQLFAQSRKPQDDYQTPVTPNADAPTSHVQLLATREQTNFTYGISLLDNADQATGTDEPTETYVGRHNAEGQLDIQLDVEHSVRWHLAHFGGLATAELAAASSPYPVVNEHTVSRQDLAASLQLPAYEFVDYLPGSKKNRRYLSMLSRELQITGVNEDTVQRMTVRQSYVGSGKLIEPSGLIWAPTSGYHVEAATNRKYFTGLHARLSIGDYDGSGAGQNVVNYADCRLRRWNVTYRNEYLEAEAICPGAGLYFYNVNGNVWKATTVVAEDDVLVWQGRIYLVTAVTGDAETGASAPVHTTGSAANGDATLQLVNFGGIANWLASTPVALGEYLASEGRLYLVTVAGTTTTTTPQHTSGTATNGTATLKFIAVIAESGAVSGQLLLVRRTAEPEFVIDAEANSPFIEDQRGQKPLDIVFGAIGGLIRPTYNYQMLHHLYNVSYETVGETFLNGLLRYTIKPRVKLDLAQNKVVEVKFRNSKADSEYV
jgi:hypothetical protein